MVSKLGSLRSLKPHLLVRGALSFQIQEGPKAILLKGRLSLNRLSQPLRLYLPKKRLAFITLLVVGLLTLSILWLGSPRNISTLIAEGDRAFGQSNYQAAFSYYKKAANANPFDPKPHLQLAKLYQLTNNWEKAKIELSLAAEFSSDLMEISKEQEKVRQAMAKPKEIEEKIRYWEGVVKEKPDYRDAWVQLAANYYQLYQYSPAKSAISKALEVDPNFEPAKQLNDLIP